MHEEGAKEMRLAEDFTRCKCGCAWIEKREYMTANYKKNEYIEKTSLSLVEYRCKECGELIMSSTIDTEGE